MAVVLNVLHQDSHLTQRIASSGDGFEPELLEHDLVVDRRTYRVDRSIDGSVSGLGTGGQ